MKKEKGKSCLKSFSASEELGALSPVLMCTISKVAHTDVTKTYG
jgi:hypothetical protein